uniref:LRRNT domain-containing protein n=1 Tax=Hippocampus comes TaxID=109280 RepID=A0A3Q2YUG0_HIPCM
MRLLFTGLLSLALALGSPSFFLPSAASTRSCPRRCLCYEHSDLVDCRERGLWHVPGGLPHGTWLLDHNRLASVGPGVFRGLSRLRQLDLHGNRLSAVLRGSLDMLPGLEVQTRGRPPARSAGKRSLTRVSA